MEIEQEHPSNLPLQQLLTNKTHKQKLIHILHQTLTQMGYHQSAKQLQQEANLHPQQEPQYKLQQFFDSKEYEKALGFVKTLDLSKQIHEELLITMSQLQVLQFIQDKDYQSAIQIVTSVWQNDQLHQVKYLTMIGTCEEVQLTQFVGREQSVIAKCTSQSFELKSSIQHLLKGYLDGQNQITKPEQTFIRKKAISERLIGLGKPSFIKLNPKATLVCMICQTHKETQISIWSFSHETIIMEHHWKLQSFGNVHMINWNDQGTKIAICSHSKIACYQVTKICQPLVVPSRSFINQGRLLCCRWHPEGTLYFGGLFDLILGVTLQGHIIRTIQPFIRTRDMIFQSDDVIFALGATKSIIVKYNLKEQRTLKTFESKASFMDMQYYKKIQTLIITNRDYIHFLNSNTLEIRHSVVSPTNDRMYKIQAYLANNWLIVFNQKLNGILQDSSVTSHHNWPDCDCMDIKNNKMITVKNDITLWQSDQTQVFPQVQLEIMRGEQEMEGEEWFSQGNIAVGEQMVSISSSQEQQQPHPDEDSSDLDPDNEIQIQYIQNSNESSQEDI